MGFFFDQPISKKLKKIIKNCKNMQFFHLKNGKKECNYEKNNFTLENTGQF